MAACAVRPEPRRLVPVHPEPGFTGTDAFTDVIGDGHGRFSCATVTVTVVPRPSVSGRIWDDTDHDGLADTNEASRAGVQVQLLDANNNVVATASTDANGLFLFADVIPGEYRVRVLPPTDYEFTYQGGDSDVNSAGYSALFTPNAGDAPDVTADCS